MKKWLFIGVIFLSYASPVCAEVLFEMNTLLPTLRLDLGGTNGARHAIDLKDALDIGDIGVMETKVRLSDHFRLSYVDFAYGGSAGLIDVGQGVSLDSRVDLQYGGATFFAPIQVRDAWRADWLLHLKGYRVGGQMSALYSDHELLTVKPSTLIGVAPSIGISAAAEVGGGIHAYGETAFLPLGSLGSLWEADTGLKYQAGDATSLHIGYRLFNVVTHNSALRTELVTRISGPYFGLNYDF